MARLDAEAKSKSEVPSYKVKTLEKLRNKLKLALMDVDAADIMSNDTVDSVLKLLNVNYSEKSVKALESILTLHAEEINIEKLCTTLSAYKEKIASGQLYQEWTPSSKRRVWGLFHCTGITRTLSQKIRYTLELRVLAGPAAGYTFKKVFSKSYIKMLLRTIGGGKDFHPCEDMFNLYFTAVMGVKMGQIILEKAQAISSQLSNNKELLKKRAGKCLLGITKSGKCILCPKGVDACTLARRQVTLTMGECKSHFCPEKHQGYIEKDGICMKCLIEGRFPKT